VACLLKHDGDPGPLPLQLVGERCQAGSEDLLHAGEVLSGLHEARAIQPYVGGIPYLEPPGASWAMVTSGDHIGRSRGSATMTPMKAKDATIRPMHP
jgi:hypothetical protein